jgi:hypothetical protein
MKMILRPKSPYFYGERAWGKYNRRMLLPHGRAWGNSYCFNFDTNFSIIDLYPSAGITTECSCWSEGHYWSKH